MRRMWLHSFVPLLQRFGCRSETEEVYTQFQAFCNGQLERDKW